MTPIVKVTDQDFRSLDKGYRNKKTLIIVTSFNKDIRRRFYTWNKGTFNSTSDATPGTNNTMKAASTRQQTTVNK
ncbi:hypothetical protein L596_012355 [Steinernema carpocapsae]|uniref:Uncharacterized protein n=1 Tax=Steinernema carpocapsae TaxID=34508 RepID=A0A4U5NWT0_STECR|nr:hypothetical protein L596_012355 [Steinernema carpocapsae]